MKCLQFRTGLTLSLTILLALGSTSPAIAKTFPLMKTVSSAGVEKPINRKSEVPSSYPRGKTFLRDLPNGQSMIDGRIVEDFGKLPLQFEPNHGQTDEQVQFVARASGYNLFLTATDAVMVLNGRRKAAGHSARLARDDKNALLNDPNSPQAVVRMKFLGSNKSAQAMGADKLTGTSNYFLSKDPANWRTSVPRYAKVKYENVYPGIDLVYYGNQRELEYDFIVAPGADPGSIQIAFDGAERIAVDASGNLVLDTTYGKMQLAKPFVYQNVNGVKNEIAGSYIVNSASGSLSFQLASYDPRRPLVIDPVLSYASYLGGSAYGEGGESIAVGSDGSIYVTGVTRSLDFPTHNPIQPTSGGYLEAFITKLNPDGSAIIYSSYLGGNGDDFGKSLVVDESGNVFVTGMTDSFDFPIMPGAFQSTLSGIGAGICQIANERPVNTCPDAFVVKLNAEGSGLVYSTYLGGSLGEEFPAIAVDSLGRAVVTGSTQSPDFPILNALQPAFGGGGLTNDAFVTKLSADGSSVIYSTYLGGGGADGGNAITVDTAGNAYVTGFTGSSTFPSTPGVLKPVGPDSIDAFVTKLNPIGQLVYSTFLGGSGAENGGAIAVDSSGNAYVTGRTFSIDFPIVNPIQPEIGGFSDIFVAKVNIDGSALLYSTYVGGTDQDEGRGIAVDASGQAYVTGFTTSANFPIFNFWEPTFGGFIDAIVMKVASTGSQLIFSSYLGGGDGDLGKAIALDGAGNAYVTGNTGSFDFPIEDPLQPACGTSDPFCNTAFIVKISPSVQLSATQYTVFENQGSAVVTVLSDGVPNETAVDFSTHDGTARAGVDYIAVSARLSFAPGETRKTVTIPIVDNPLATGNKTIGLSLNNATGAALGPTNLAVLNIVENDVPPLALVGRSLPDAEMGVNYTAPLATGGVGPYMFALTKGVFPPGLSPLSANGSLIGVPGSTKVGAFTVKITDQLGSSVTGTFRIKILKALSIATTALKTGRVGRAYHATLKADGGSKPRLWSLIDGTLPLGLSFDSGTGKISGIPTAPGSFNLTFEVTDPLGGISQKSVTLIID